MDHPLCLHPDPHHQLGNHILSSNLQHINGGSTGASSSSSSSSSTTSPLPDVVSPFSGLLPAMNFLSPINSHKLIGAASSGLKSDHALDLYDQLHHQFDPILMLPYYSTSVDHQQLLQSPLSDCPLSKINYPLSATSPVSSANPNENCGTTDTTNREMKPSSTGAALCHQTIMEAEKDQMISGANSSYAPYSLADYNPFAAANFLHNLVDIESLFKLEPYNVQTSATMASDQDQCQKSSSSDESMGQPESSTMTNDAACTKYKAQVHQPAPKRSRKSQQKRVICVPATGGLDRPTSECLPSDSWAWRKYGQKPIKGTPYPRSYYKCSSFKGCTGRKQVERSPTDPSMLLITYIAEHNHGSRASTNTSRTTSATTDLPTNPSSLASQATSPQLSTISYPMNIASEDSFDGQPIDSKAIPSLSSLIDHNDEDDDNDHGNDGIHDDHVVNSPPTTSDQEVEDNQLHDDVVSSQKLQHSIGIDDNKVPNTTMPSSIGCHHMNGTRFDRSLAMGNHHYHMHVNVGSSVQYVDKQEEDLFAQLEELSSSFSFFEDSANCGITVDPFSLYNWSTNISPTW